MFIFGNPDSPMDPTRRRWLAALASAPALGMVGSTSLLTKPAAAADAPAKPGYYGVPRTWLWNPGFNAWSKRRSGRRLLPTPSGSRTLRSPMHGASPSSTACSGLRASTAIKIKHFLVTDANDDPHETDRGHRGPAQSRRGPSAHRACDRRGAEFGGRSRDEAGHSRGHGRSEGHES